MVFPINGLLIRRFVSTTLYSSGDFTAGGCSTMHFQGKHWCNWQASALQRELLSLVPKPC